jgi:hypothetical protein
MQVGQVIAKATLLPPPFGAAKGRAGEGLLLLLFLLYASNARNTSSSTSAVCVSTASFQ